MFFHFAFTYIYPPGYTLNPLCPEQGREATGVKGVTGRNQLFGKFFKFLLQINNYLLYLRKH